jgi:hypothetical protein
MKHRYWNSSDTYFSKFKAMMLTLSKRLATLLVVFRSDAFVERFKNVMRVVIFQIMEYDGNQNSVSDLQVAVVTQRIDEFSRRMVIMPDFFVTMDERFVASRAPLCSIETFLLLCSER